MKAEQDKQKQSTFREIYHAFPKRNIDMTQRQQFVERIATVTKKSKKTIYCWIAGAYKPDALSQSMIEKELGIPASELFPVENRD